MDAVAPYDTTFTPQYRLKIVAGKPVYVPEYQQRAPVETNLSQSQLNHNAPSPMQPFSRTSQNGPSSAEKRNTWTSHSVLPPISPRAVNSPGMRSNRSQSSNSKTSSHLSKANSSVAGSRAASNTKLPQEPITLDKEDEFNLLQNIGTALQLHDMDILKEIYNDISSSYDSQLSGWATFSDIVYVLNGRQVYLAMDDLKLAASLFVSSDRPGCTNYEKLLSFIASALKLKNNKREDHPQYFEPAKKEYSNLEFLSINTRLPRPSGEISGAQGKLMRLVEEQLQQGEGPVDLTHLSNQFALADRLHRDSLSHGEESVINHVLDRCRTTGDGQYRWTDFIEFLEKVQPVGTGLNFTSKRPLEYAKVLPEPKDSWPRAALEGGEPPSTYKYAPKLGVEQTQNLPQAQQMERQEKVTSPIKGGKHASSLSHVTAPNGKHMHSDAIQTDEFGIASNSSQDNAEEDWMTRFEKLAQAMYRNDLDKNGYVAPEECRWLVTEYNDIYKLGYTRLFIDQSIQKHFGADGVAIDGLLKELMQSV